MEVSLNDDQIEAALKKLNVAWSAIPGQGLVRVFKTGNFSSGVVLISKIAELANQLHHHPDVHISYDEVEVTLTTHSAGGVTQKDFEMATLIDKLS